MHIITLTTDFGFGPYVAELKGAILSIQKAIRFVDVTHDIPPQDVRAGALVLRQIQHAFAAETVHLAVVDPGVGTQRTILVVRAFEQYFIAPDNGLLTFQLEHAEDVKVIDQPRFWRAETSTTFHGRDIMGPVAAHLCSDVSIDELGSPVSCEPQRMDIPRCIVAADHIDGEVIDIDHFGNLITNVGCQELDRLPSEASLAVGVGSHTIAVADTYGSVRPGELLALVGSSGWLEVAVSCGDAAAVLGVAVGQQIRVFSPLG